MPTDSFQSMQASTAQLTACRENLETFTQLMAECGTAEGLAAALIKTAGSHAGAFAGVVDVRDSFAILMAFLLVEIKLEAVMSGAKA